MDNSTMNFSLPSIDINAFSTQVIAVVSVIGLILVYIECKRYRKEQLERKKKHYDEIKEFLNSIYVPLDFEYVPLLERKIYNIGSGTLDQKITKAPLDHEDVYTETILRCNRPALLTSRKSEQLYIDVHNNHFKDIMQKIERFESEVEKYNIDCFHLAEQIRKELEEQRPDELEVCDPRKEPRQYFVPVATVIFIYNRLIFLTGENLIEKRPELPGHIITNATTLQTRSGREILAHGTDKNIEEYKKLIDNIIVIKEPDADVLKNRSLQLLQEAKAIQKSILTAINMEKLPGRCKYHQ